MWRTNDGGNTWSRGSVGLPQHDAYVGVLREAMAVDRLDAVLQLPPGWRLLHAQGPSRADGAWVSMWSLWDFFFVLLAATLNFGFFIGDIGNPELHNIFELFAALVVSLIATVLKFGDRTQIGAVHLATSLVADLQLIAATLVWAYATQISTTGLDAGATASVVSLSGGALLANMVSLVLLVVETGTSSISQIMADAPTGPVVDAALVLILVGALSKSAIFPFHFWLPGAMAAPTPVSAYLHAAAMVKAGVYLVARLAPGYADLPAWQVTLLVLGGGTMLLGAFRATRQTDLKLLLAYGTVSQLGFLTLLLAYGSPGATLAGLTLVLAHALFKSSLFLTVGTIDHAMGTRDIRRLVGVRQKMPLLALSATLAAMSMAGLPVLLGFVGKEAALAAVLHPVDEDAEDVDGNQRHARRDGGDQQGEDAPAAAVSEFGLQPRPRVACVRDGQQFTHRRTA